MVNIFGALLNIFGEYKFLLPEFIVFFLIFINTIVLFFQNKEKPTLSSFISMIILFACPLIVVCSDIIPGLALDGEANSAMSKNYNFFTDLYLVNKTNLIIKLLLIISVAFVHLFVILMPKRNNHITLFGLSELPILINLSLFGMICAVGSNHFMILYLGLELASLPTYVLVAIKREQLKSSEAALKYFVLGVMASSIFLYGVSLIYMHAGTLSFEEIARFLAGAGYGTSGLMIAGIIFVFIGLMFKLSAAPLHAWIADVYEGSHNIVVAFISVAPKLMAAFIILILYKNVFIGNYHNVSTNIIVIFSVLSLIFGTLTAIKQKNFKRFLAYSGVANSGFILLAILGMYDYAFRAIVIYSASYMIAVYGLISFAMFYWDEEDYSYDPNHMSLERDRSQYLISHMHGLAREYPLLGMSICFCLFSLAGIPPFIGFIGKFNVLLSGFSAMNYSWLVFLALIASVISLIYYLNILKVIYFEAYTKLDYNHFQQYKRISIFFGMSLLFSLLLFGFKVFAI